MIHGELPIKSHAGHEWQVLSARKPYFFYNKRVTPFHPREMRRKRCSKMSVTRHRQRDSFIVAGLERRTGISNPRAARGRAFVTGKKSAAPGAAAGGSRGRKSGAGGAGGGIASDAIREAPEMLGKRGGFQPRKCAAPRCDKNDGTRLGALRKAGPREACGLDSKECDVYGKRSLHAAFQAVWRASRAECDSLTGGMREPELHGCPGNR